jgi:protein involved in polysaccharide export with SLBB domain/beta-lactamase regulating signal transducer with metallopeptidase domain
MNTLNELLVHPVFQRLGWTLAHSLWEGAAVALLVAMVLAMLARRSSQARYVAGCAGLALMFAALIVTFFALPGPIVRQDAILPTGTESVRAPGVMLSPMHVTRSGPPAPAPTIAQRLQSLLPAFAALWIIGIAVLSLRHVGGWLRVQQLRKAAQPLVGEQWECRMRRACERLGVKRAVTLAESALVQVPAVVGYLKPVILLPISAMSGLSPQQLEGNLANELAHVRRHDYLVNLVQIVIETLLFYHPAAWWLSRRIRQERENCCDDLAASVCGNRIAYVQALAAMEELRMVPGELVLGARGGNLLPRVRRLLGVQSPRQRSWSLTAAIVVVVVALVPLLVAQHKAKADEAKPATKPTTSTIRADDLVATTNEYTIGVGDLVQVSIMGLTANGVETVKSGRVSEKGEIPLPYLGRVKAAGLSESELEKSIAKSYQDKRLIDKPQVSASVVEARGRTFSIIGNVARPGQYVIAQNDFRLLDALTIAGGLTDSPESATVIRKEGDQDRPIVSPLKDLTAGELKYNVVIRPKDTIVIGTLGKVPANPVASSADPFAANAQRMSPEMKELLDKKLPEVNFPAVPFSDAIDFLRDVTGANIVVAWNAIEGAGLGRNTPVTVRVRDVSVAKGLELVLDAASTNQVKIRYTVDENVIRIAPELHDQTAESQALSRDQAELTAELNELRKTYGENHKLVQQKKAQLDTVTRQMQPAQVDVSAPKVDPKTKAQLERELPEVNFEAIALSDVIDFLRDVTTANIFVNWNALEAAGIDRNTPVTLRLRNVAFGKVLDLLLAAVSGGTNTTLAYTVDQGVISISAAESKPAPDAAVLKARHRMNEIDLEIAKLQAQGVGPNHAALSKLDAERSILAKRVVSLIDGEIASSPAPVTQPAIYDAVRIVVAPQKVTLDGEESTWEQAKETLSKLPNRGEIVLEVAVASDQMTLAQHNEALSHGLQLANELKFKSLSDVGVHPLGSKAGEAAKPPATQPSANASNVPAAALGPGEFYIGGHVVRPGVYSLTDRQGIRLLTAIDMAGGLDKEVAQLRITRKVPGKPDKMFRISLQDLTDPDKNEFVYADDTILVGSETLAPTTTTAPATVHQ